MSIAALILGAGGSSRMGTPKQLLQVGQTTLLGVAIENALASKVDHVFCVLGAYIDDIRPSIERYKVEIIVNSNYEKGLSSSIVEGVLHLQEKNVDAVLIMLGDQPFIAADYLDEMIDLFREHQTRIIATSYKEKVGVPVILSSTFFPELSKLHGDQGAKEFLNGHMDHIKRLKNNRSKDIDTQEDYQDLLRTKDIG